MPPKKGGRITVKTQPDLLPPLLCCTIALSGTFPGHSHAAIEENFISPLGASLSKGVLSATTHLITTEVDFGKPSAKVAQAKQNDVNIVKLAWLEDCLSQSTKLPEQAYQLDTSGPLPDPSTVSTDAKINGHANESRKRTAVGSGDAVATANSDDDAEDSGSQSRPQRSKRLRTTKAGNDASKNSNITGLNSIGSQSQKTPQPAITNGAKPKRKKTNVAKFSDLHVPLDETCPLTQYRVYIDKSGVIYDASLNQTNATHNNNKFYRLQLLHNGKGEYKTWSRWGRVGEHGQSATLGDGTLDSARNQFDKKFYSKSGLTWSGRYGNPRPGKYTFVEKSYDEDSDDEHSNNEETTAIKVEESETLEAPQSKLDPAVQELLELIFNKKYFAATMTDFNYDAKKLPLGKLSKLSITRGYQALKDLSALLSDASLASTQYNASFEMATEQLSNAFYSVIPHAFGRHRPPIIQDHALLKKEVELLDSLSDMKEAANIMKGVPKDTERIHALDKQFEGLNLDEITPLDRKSEEYIELQTYLTKTRGSTHGCNYNITQIFRIERRGEKARFEESAFSGIPSDRRLLWHGSRCTNFGGILSQGLRIAPPEAPVSGYMFGKGIYLADMSSKSANYCCAYTSGNNALLLLCEAELGDPIYKLTQDSFTADAEAKENGMFSTLGQGRIGPLRWKDAKSVHPSLEGVKMPDTTLEPDKTEVEGACLMYNEYIAYDVSQVRLRYLFQVQMK